MTLTPLQKYRQNYHALRKNFVSAVYAVLISVININFLIKEIITFTVV